MSDPWQRLFRDEEEALSFFLREEFTEMTTIAIPMEDPIIHTAATGYYCSSLSNPDWATCPCRVAMEEQVREWQAEQAAAAIATECRIAREQAELQEAWDQLQAVPSYIEQQAAAFAKEDTHE